MPNPFLISTLTLITTLATTPTIANTNLNFNGRYTTLTLKLRFVLAMVGVVARVVIKVKVDSPLKLRFVLAMVGVVARVVIKVKVDIKNGFGIWLF
jgi:hypothetical protein